MDLLIVGAIAGTVWIFVIALVLAMCRAAALADQAIFRMQPAVLPISGKQLALARTEGSRSHPGAAAL